MSSEADARGLFGEYGGRFVPETLVAALDELDERVSGLILPSPPASLGTLERKYEEFQHNRREIHATFSARRAELDLVHLRLRLRVCISSLPVLRIHFLIDRN